MSNRGIQIVPAPGAGASDRRHSQRSGFTLAEVLAAMVFMAIVIPVALEGLSVASRAGEVAVRKSQAALVGERILNEQIVMTNWDQAMQNGVVRQGVQEYRWTLRSQPWNLDANLGLMRLLTVEVNYAAQGREYAVCLSTLVDSATPVSLTNSY